MKNKKILMVLEHTFPPDIRVEKEAKALLDAGFNLSLICMDNGKNIDSWKGMKLYKIKYPRNLYTRFLSSILTIHPYFYNYLDVLLENEKFDFLHVHDLRLAPTVLKIKEKYNVKVILDLHENYPAAVKEWNKSGNGIKGLVNKIFNTYGKWKKIESFSLKYSDKVIAVVDEMKDRMLSQHIVDKSKIIVISNLEDKDFVKNSKLDISILEKYKDKFIVLYIGGFGTHRGIDTAIKGMQYIDKNDILLLLVGKGSSKIENEFKHLIKKYNLENKVEILGWQPFEKVFTYQKLASVCIVPHNSNEHTDNTIPHKLYQYMMIPKPIIVSSCKPLARIVNEAKTGLIFNAGDAKDFAKKLLDLYSSKDLQDTFIENGFNYTYNQNHTWQDESKKLITMYRNL